jgi:WD40 repeat protein
MFCISRLAVVLLIGFALTTRAQTPSSPTDAKPRVDALGDPLPPGALLRLGTVRWRPSGYIQHLAFAPDGKKLASWHDEHYTTAAVTLLDVGTGWEERRVEMPGLRILSWDWLADGRGVSVVQTSEGIYVWEFTDAKMVPPHKPSTGARGSFKVDGGKQPDNEDLSCYAVSPDGKHLVAGKAGALANKERPIVIWDLATQQRIADLPKPRRLATAPNNCSALFFTPDAKKLVVFCPSLDKKTESKELLVAVIDVDTGKELRRFMSPAPLRQGSRMSGALSADLLALGLEDPHGIVPLWNIGKGEDRRLVTGHGQKSNFSGYGVSALAFSPDGKLLITAGRDGDVKIWDAATSKEVRTIAKAYPGWIETLAVTPDGKSLACAGQDGIIRHWNLTTGAALDAVDGHGGRVSGVSVTPDGAVAVTSCADRRLCLWDLITGREQGVIPLPPPHAYWPTAVMAPDGRTVVVTGAEKLTAWNVADGQQVPLFGPLAELKSGRVEFAGDGKSLLALEPSAVTLLDWPSGKLRRKFTMPAPLQQPGESHCDAAALSADGRWLATVGHRAWHRDERGMRFGYASDGVLDLWDAVTGERVHRLVDGGSVARTALFTAEGDLLFAGAGNLHPRAGDAKAPLKGEFHLIDALTGRLKLSFEPAPQLPGSTRRYNSAMGIAPNGRSIFCSGNDGVIHIYETASGKIRRSLVRHRDYISALAFTRDGRRLLSASNDLTALVWDIALTAAGPTSAAAPSPDEQTRLWERLSGPDAKDAYLAMTTLAAQPKVATAMIRAHIKPAVSSPTDATLDRLVAELGDDAFAVRERATRELDELGEAAVAGMRGRLAPSATLETQRRIVRFLDKHDPATITPGQLREIRSLEILEQLPGPDGRVALEELAKGAPNARVTRAAVGALARQK